MLDAVGTVKWSQSGAGDDLETNVNGAFRLQFGFQVRQPYSTRAGRTIRLQLYPGASATGNEYSGGSSLDQFGNDQVIAVPLAGPVPRSDSSANIGQIRN